MRFGFIGTGDLAVYTIRGLRHGGYSDNILLSPRNSDKAALLARECDCEIAADNQDVVNRSDAVIIATRPAHCLDALAELDIPSGKLLVSVVAGVDIETLRSALSTDIDIVRAMPVSSAEVGASPTLIYPAHDEVSRLFNYCGNALVADREDYFNEGSVLACVYCWFFTQFETLIRATGEPRLPRELSAQLVMGMARGAAELALARQDMTPGDIADAIATDGTYSRLGLDLLLRENAFAPWHEACELLQEKLGDKT